MVSHSNEGVIGQKGSAHTHTVGPVVQSCVITNIYSSPYFSLAGQQFAEHLYMFAGQCLQSELPCRILY